MLAAPSVTSGKVLHENVETPIGSAFRLEFVSALFLQLVFLLILKPRGVLLFELLLL